MTTSNHRPYTYPDGRIDIRSGDGREGAVKYTDHAIGEFLTQARKKPWFDNTVFVFVASHTAGSAGKEDLPVANYHIPLFIYAPSVVAPREVTTVASQIDLAPTLLGLLNFDYTSTFFGRNVMTEEPGRGRALVGNYQHLGLFDGASLAILDPRRPCVAMVLLSNNSREVAADASDALVRRNVAYYQGASHDFSKGLLAWRPGTEPTTRLTCDAAGVSHGESVKSLFRRLMMSFSHDSASRHFDFRLALGIPLLLMAVLLAFDIAGLDFWLERLFYVPGEGFVGRHSFWLRHSSRPGEASGDRFGILALAGFLLSVVFPGGVPGVVRSAIWFWLSACRRVSFRRSRRSPPSGARGV